MSKNYEFRDLKDTTPSNKVSSAKAAKYAKLIIAEMSIEQVKQMLLWVSELKTDLMLRKYDIERTS